MPKFGSITHGEFTGDIIAGQITKALEAGEPIWRAVGNVLDLFFDEKWIEISFDPSVTPVYGQGDSPVSPLTKAWQVDPLTELPVAVWFKSGWGLLEWSQFWVASSGGGGGGGGGTLVPTRWPGPMTPVGADDAGTPPSNQWADGRHSHPYSPAPPPTTLATSTLYTAKVGASLFRGDVYCAFMSYTSCVGALFAGWTEISPGIMQKDDVGPLSSALFDGMDVDIYNTTGVSSMIGRTVFAFDVAIDDYSKTLTGPWIVDDVGAHYENYGTPDTRFVETNARMHRAPDYSYSAAFVTGMQFQIDNGATYGGGYLTLTSTSVVLGTTPMAWTWASGVPAPSDEKWELLTGPQLTSEGALTDTLQQSVSGSGLGVGVGFNETLLPLQFDTLLGTPGTDLLAGPYVVDIEDVAASPTADPGALVIIRAKLYDVEASALIMFVDAPVTAVGSMPEAIHAVTALASTYPWTPGHHLRIKFALWTDSLTPVLLGMGYNSSARGTKITVPFVMPVTGASDGVHGHLSGRDAADQHPTKAISPDTKTDVTIVSGVMPAVPYGSFANVTAASADLDAMDAAGWPSNGVLEVYFAVACAIRSDQSVTGTNRPIRTYKGTFATYQVVNVRAGATATFRFRPDLGSAGMWLLKEMQQG